jgi:hypothetical protein
MSVGELQACSRAINGCVRRLFSVFFSYSFREASKMACKLEEEELEAVGVVLDMVTVAMRGPGSGRMMRQCGCVCVRSAECDYQKRSICYEVWQVTPSLTRTSWPIRYDVFFRALDAGVPPDSLTPADLQG